VSSKKSGSNPAAPTTFCLGKRKVSVVTPPLIPPSTAAAAPGIGQALVAAGQALLAAGNAMLGKSGAGFDPTAFPRFGPPPMSFTEAMADFLRAKALANRGDRHLKRLHHCLKNFARKHGRTPLTQITAVDLEQWIDGSQWAPKTARNYLNDVSILFNWAFKRGYIDRNPALGVERKVIHSTKPICVHTPEQARLVLETARKANPDVCRQLAIRYFAGLRTSEAHLLRETHLKLEQNLLEVPAENSKTRRRRLVTIQPNLRAWLDLGGELRPIGVMTVRRVVRLSQVDWPPNVTRHSFVSYHLAHLGSAAKTAIEAGHSEQMLFTHYRALVTPAAAAEYWAVVPTPLPVPQPACS
jgi:integrase